MTTETPMRERIARALKELSISRVSAGGEVSWEELADAVLDAMREPTSGMSDAVRIAADNGGFSDEYLNHMFTAAIDAAKEGK